MDGQRDKFPIGMRVLAVDDDTICLRVLERLLQRCQYDVTVTSNAISALKLLRENKGKFDLVITDVVMPDMDGFTLLELIGLEMDLPVIMLSGNDDRKKVMKGITHGACDYLLKPVRIEELKNIWQHVVRKKKIASKERSKSSDQDMPNSGIRNAVESPATGNSDQNGRETRKRKDQDEDEEDGDDEEDGESSHDNEDSSTQKKARVVWSVELHRKSFATGGLIGSSKTPAGLFGTNPFGHAQNLNNSTNDQLKFQSAIRRGYQNGIQGIPTSASLVQNLTNLNDTKTSFPVSNNNLADQLPKVTMGCSPASVLGISNNALMLEANTLLDTKEMSEFPFSDMDHDIWSSAVHSSRTNSYPPSECFRQAPSENATSSFTSLFNQCHDPLTDMHSQGIFSSNNPRQLTGDFSFPWWYDHNPDSSYHSSAIGSSLTPLNGVVDPQSQNSFIANNPSSLEDLVTSLMKKNQDNNHCGGGTSM
ncbi:hypothetical protein RIF29_27235 [Crotalaria pallida]|uniref:Response regulatory domain-containing protein n=1 Tax=Crotalaria pallida TaxID=3830 RepID=A0AAN9I0U8_CROPI